MNDTKRATAAYIASHKTDALDAQRIGKAFEDGAKWAIQATIDWLEWLQRTGSAELPEVVDDNAHLKELFEVAQREMEKINKRNDTDFADLLKAMQTGNAGISAEMPCKSDAE